MKNILFIRVAIGRGFWWNGRLWRKLDEDSALADNEVRIFQLYDRVDTL